MLQKAYSSIGGFKSASSKDELIDDSFIWKLILKDKNIKALSIYKNRFGRKGIVAATDGTPEGKNMLYDMLRSDAKLGRAWYEASGKMEYIFAKVGSPKIPNTFAEKATGKKILELNPDGFHYTRIIAGIPIEKIMFGKLEGI